MKRIILYPYSMKCEGYGLLRDTLRKMLGEDAVLGVHPDGKYVPKSNDLIVDWGFSKGPNWAAKTKPEQLLNPWHVIGNAVHKHTALYHMKLAMVEVPDFTTSAKEAAYWVSQEIPIVQRTMVKGSKGEGASVAHTPKEFDPFAKLYTKLIPKKREFRVHVFQNKVIDKHEKIYLGKNPKEFEIMVSATEEQDGKWEWKRSGVILPNTAVVESVKAVKSLGLDFGGVDVVTDASGRAFILEVNTAPWLGTTTVKYYAEAIKKAAA